MNARIWYEICLKFVKIDVESPIEPQAGRDRTDNLGNQSVEMFIVWSCDIKVSSANVVDCFIVDKECAVGVFNCAVSRQNSTV